MDFVQFFMYSEYLTYFFDISNMWLTALIVAICGFAVMYMFRAWGLFVIAKREKYGHKWMAFVPFLSTYYIGDVARKNKIFNSDARIFSGITAGLEVLMVAGYLLYYIVFFILDRDGLISYDFDGYYTYVTVSIYAEPFMQWIFNNMDMIMSIAEIVFMVMFLFELMPFFMTYNTRGYAIMSIFAAVFPISGLLIFVVRRNRGKNYREYMKQQQEAQYRQYQQSQQNGTPYGGNPYSRNYYGGAPRGQNPGQQQPDGQNGQNANAGRQQDIDPFDDFDTHTTPDDPFDFDENEIPTDDTRQNPYENPQPGPQGGDGTPVNKGTGRAPKKPGKGKRGEKEEKKEEDTDPFNDF